MEIELNWIAIILAALSTMVVGSIWYGPLFGKAWEKLAKVKPEADWNARKATLLYSTAFIVSFVTAVVLAVMTSIVQSHFGSNNLLTALWTGLILWAGFTAARIHMHDSFERRPTKLTLMTVVHELVTIEIMALIIGVWPA